MTQNKLHYLHTGIFKGITMPKLDSFTSPTGSKASHYPYKETLVCSVFSSRIQPRMEYALTLVLDYLYAYTFKRGNNNSSGITITEEASRSMDEALHARMPQHCLVKNRLSKFRHMQQLSDITSIHQLMQNVFLQQYYGNTWSHSECTWPKKNGGLSPLRHTHAPLASFTVLFEQNRWFKMLQRL